MMTMSNEREDTGELVIATSRGRVLVRIQKDGTLTYGPEYTPDEAADVFWHALARRRAEANVREGLLGHIEQVMLKLGQQDLRNEQCQIKARSDSATPDDVFQAERTHSQLEVYVHQLIELARGLALRSAEEALPQPIDDHDLN